MRNRKRITRRQRNRLRRLVEKATPGPWKCHGETDGEPGVSYGDWIAARPVLGPEHVGSAEDRAVVWALWVENDHEVFFGFRSEADRAFIEEARTAVPVLLDDLDAAEARIKALENEAAKRRADEETRPENAPETTPEKGPRP
jgi:hypothetical protein